MAPHGPKGVYILFLFLFFWCLHFRSKTPSSQMDLKLVGFQVRWRGEGKSFGLGSDQDIALQKKGEDSASCVHT